MGAAQKDIYSTVSLLKELGHEVSLYTINQSGQDLSLINEWQKFSPQFSFLEWLWPTIFSWALLDRSAFVFDKLSRDPSFLNHISQFQPEIIFSYGNYSWPIYASAIKVNAKFIIRSHNYEPLHFWEELAGFQKFNFLNWLRFAAKWLSEKKSVQFADAVAAISPNEEKIYQKWGREKIFLLPLVSLFATLKPAFVHEHKNVLDIFYMGASYNIPFHLRGAEVLIKEIAPKVEALMPGKFKFHILGAKLPFMNLTSNIIYEGFVGEDQLDNFFATMDVGIFPVFSGRGMKQKIFESLCRSFPVIAPKISIGEYALKNNQHFIEANSADQFASSIISLNSISLRKELSIGANQFASTNFNRQNFVKILNNLCQRKKHL